MENKEKLYKIYYGEQKDDYIKRYLKEEDVLDGFLSESKAFDLFFASMIICNDYLQHNYENVEPIIDNYNEETDEYIDEFQVFIIEPEFDEEITKKAVEKMYNTLYYDNKLDLYITGITDLGTSRTIVPTSLHVVEVDD